MKVYVHKDAFELGIVHPVGCIISNVSVLRNDALLQDSVERLVPRSFSISYIANSPVVTGFKDVFIRLGYPNQTPAGIRLLDGIIKKGFKHINNVIDAYNIISAKYVSGLGLHCISSVDYREKDLHILRAQENQYIVPIFRSRAECIPIGDLVYGVGSKSNDTDADSQLNHFQPMAWLGKKDVDSDDFKVTAKSTSLLLVILGNQYTTFEYNISICREVLDLINITSPNISYKILDTEYLYGCNL